MLRRNVEIRSTVETKASILEEMRVIRMHLENDEEEDLRFRVSRPLTRVNQSSVASDGTLDSDLGISSIPSDSGEPPVENIPLSHTSWRESALARSFTKSSTTFSLRSRKFGSSYHSAALFDDCKHAIFNNDSEFSVFRLGDLTKGSPKFSTILTQQYKHGEFIRNVASSRAFIITVTNKRLLVFKIDADKVIPVDTISHGDWDPSGLACHESETHLVAFLGQCQRNKTSRYDGQIRVYKYRIDGQVKKLPASTLNVPANDCPKRLSFGADSQILACITRIQNRILVWRLDDEFLSSQEPFEFLKNKYTAVSTQTPTGLADRC